MASTWEAARAQAAASPVGGKIVPSGGTETGISYRFEPDVGALSAYNKNQSQLSKMEAESTARNKKREDEIRKMLDQIIGMYQPGGGFGKGMEGQIERGRTQSVASGMQGLVSAGLSNTTQAAGLGKKYEEEVAMPARMKLEDVRYGALSQAIGQKASFIERIEDMMPDYNMIAQLLAKSAGA